MLQEELQLRQGEGYELPTGIVDSQCFTGRVYTEALTSGNHKIGTLNSKI